MDTVLSLICNPRTPLLEHCSLVADVRHAIETITGVNVRCTALADGIAEDFLFDLNATAGDHNAVANAAYDLIEGRAVDVVVQPATRRARRLLIADMDSTIIEQECIDELAEYAGRRAEISEITERAMRGELDFDAALKERVAMLQGLSASVLEDTFRDRITLTPGARTLVQTMNKRGAVTALVSGGFTFFTERVAAATGFHTTQANQLLIENDALTGAVVEPILGRAAKQDALLRLAAKHDIALEETIAVGDGANDLSMLGRAGLGVAFHAKPAVAQAAHARIDHGDLTALLYLQGIAKSEFVLD